MILTKHTNCDSNKPKANKLPDSLVKMGDNLCDKHIITKSVELYRDQPKDLQVEAVASLVQGKHTFVQAGTGFGKTRISEMFFGLFNRKVIVLVLNPLDSLGNDQVCQNYTLLMYVIILLIQKTCMSQVCKKTLVKITAINLNKMTLDKETVEKIKKGAFSFVYLVGIIATIFNNSHICSQ
jgi:superfamily II DNA or RNA helicase